MKKLIPLTTLLSLLIVFTISCDRPTCINTNPVFDHHDPDSKAYKKELVSQIKLVDNYKLTYWLKEYKEKDGKELCYFYIQGDGLCAVMATDVTNAEQLGDVRMKKGVTYRGAEFRGLKYDIIQDSANTEFVFKSYSKIID